MTLFHKHTNLLIMSALLGLIALPSMITPAIAQKVDNSGNTDKNPSLNQPNSTPTYPAAPPPERIKPLPNERQLQQRETEVDYRISNLLGDLTGNLWVGSWRGLSRIDPNTGRVISRVSLPNIAISALVQDKVGRLWVGNNEGLTRVDPQTSQITAQNLLLPSKRVLSLLLDKRGYLWVGTDAGLTLVSPDQGLIMTTVKNMPGVSVNTMTLDADGQLLGL